MTLSYREIPLSGKAGSGKVALVDEEDYAYLSQFRWHWKPAGHGCPGHEGYARRGEGPRKHLVAIYMHRDIMKPPPGLEVDHIRIGSGLDNRRCNLRVVDRHGNARNQSLTRLNKSGYRGVSQRPSGRWRATIRVRGKYYTLGVYDTPEEAHAAYEAARDCFGLIKASSD